MVLAPNLLWEKRVALWSHPGIRTRYHSKSNLDIVQCLLKNDSAASTALELEHPTDSLTRIYYAMSSSGGAMFRTLIGHGADMNHAAGARRYTRLLMLKSGS
jgi:hypothetical protein